MAMRRVRSKWVLWKGSSLPKEEWKGLCSGFPSKSNQEWGDSQEKHGNRHSSKNQDVKVAMGRAHCVPKDVAWIGLPKGESMSYWGSQESAGCKQLRTGRCDETWGRPSVNVCEIYFRWCNVLSSLLSYNRVLGNKYASRFVYWYQTWTPQSNYTSI